MFRKLILFNVIINLFCHSELFSQTLGDGDEDTIYVAVDFDNVMLFDMYPFGTQPPPPPDKILIADGDKFRIAEGAPEFLQYLSEIPNVKVIIFSFGQPNRNQEAIERIQLPNGKKLIDILTDNSGYVRLFGTDQVKDYTHESTKDFTIFPFKFSLKRTLLIDDQYGSAPNSQKSNLLLVNDNVMFEYPEVDDMGAFRDYDKETALRIRREFFRITGIIHKVLEAGKIDGDYTKALANIIWKDGIAAVVDNYDWVESYNRAVAENASLYTLGESILSKISQK
jgi:hypothetical protein